MSAAGEVLRGRPDRSPLVPQGLHGGILRPVADGDVVTGGDETLGDRTPHLADADDADLHVNAGRLHCTTSGLFRVNPGWRSE
jgi:hypothetical protein